MQNKTACGQVEALRVRRRGVLLAALLCVCVWAAPAFAQGGAAANAGAAATTGVAGAVAKPDTTVAASRIAPKDQPQVRASVSADTVLIGNRFKLRVEVTKDVMQMVAFPEFENGRLADSLEIVSEGPVDTLSRTGRKEVLAKEYELTCFTPADYRLGKFPALYVDKNLVDTLWSADSLRVIVTAPQVDTAQNTIYDIKPPMKVPLRFGEVSGYLLMGLVAALVIALLIYYFLLKRGRGLLAALRKPADPPHVAAIKQLEKLHTQKLWQSGKQKQYYTGLTDILREYLEGRYRFQAMEMTSSEIVAKMRELAVAERSSARLTALLELADFVKFAKYEPDATQSEESYTDAYYFVEETKEIPAEQQPDAPQSAEGQAGAGAGVAGAGGATGAGAAGAGVVPGLKAKEGGEPAGAGKPGKEMQR